MFPLLVLFHEIYCRSKINLVPKAYHFVGDHFNPHILRHAGYLSQPHFANEVFVLKENKQLAVTFHNFFIAKTFDNPLTVGYKFETLELSAFEDRLT